MRARDALLGRPCSGGCLLFVLLGHPSEENDFVSYFQTALKGQSNLIHHSAASAPTVANSSDLRTSGQSSLEHAGGHETTGAETVIGERLRRYVSSHSHWKAQI